MAIELLRVVQLAERQGGTQRRVIDVEADDDNTTDDSRTQTATRQSSPHLIVIEDGESDATTTDDSTDQVVANVATEDNSCPYGHAKDGPRVSPSIPHFEPFPK